MPARLLPRVTHEGCCSRCSRPALKVADHARCPNCGPLDSGVEAVRQGLGLHQDGAVWVVTHMASGRAVGAFDGTGALALAERFRQRIEKLTAWRLPLVFLARANIAHEVLAILDAMGGRLWGRADGGAIEVRS